MNANEVRQKFLDFYQKLDHKIIPPAPLVLENDATTLFTGAGMQPLMPYLLGQSHPEGKRLVDSQPCLRLQDIDDVGDARHTTVFEMLGNWSLGDYFKEEQIRYFFKFLTEELGMEPDKLYVTCFIGDEANGIPKDTESAEIWQKVFAEVGIEAKIAEIGAVENGAKCGINPGERIFYYDDGANWWSRGGGLADTPIGDPCGPDSEVFYDFGEQFQDVEKFGKSHPASDGERFMEIGNQVFMQYKRNEDGNFSELENKNVDFGGGLERITAAANGSPDVFEISLMRPIIEKLESLSNYKYSEKTADMRIIADHLRGAYLLAAQGLAPSNKQQGYALRRLIRRAILRALDLGIEENFLAETIATIASEYDSLPDAILTHREEALAILEKEEKAFRGTLRRGLKELNKMSQKNDQLSGKDLFTLQDTYGFPLELSVEECEKRGIKLSDAYKQEFEKALEEQRERSKTASKGAFKGGLADTGEQTVKYHTACHLLLAAIRKHVSPDSKQKGSNLTPERLRFDFNLDHKMTDEEKQKVEDQVNEWIEQDLPVTHGEYDKDYAFDTLHAEGSFRDRYPDKVTVYTIGDGDNPISREICGGPHVTHTGELGHFKIKKESSSSAGVRRIKAILE